MISFSLAGEWITFDTTVVIRPDNNSPYDDISLLRRHAILWPNSCIKNIPSINLCEIAHSLTLTDNRLLLCMSDSKLSPDVFRLITTKTQHRHHEHIFMALVSSFTVISSLELWIDHSQQLICLYPRLRRALGYNTTVNRQCLSTSLLFLVILITGTSADFERISICNSGSMSRYYETRGIY